MTVNESSPSSAPAWLQHARDHWQNRGQRRPDFAVTPAAGEESVWDYPRPPALVPDTRLVEVRHGDLLIATTTAAMRVLETSHPPSFYLPAESITADALKVVPGSSHCEWKGHAEYLALAGDERPVGWRYPSPYPEFTSLASFVSFYPDAVTCTVDGQTVRAQAGGFYGGWVTDEIVGPYKGEPGSSGW